MLASIASALYDELTFVNILLVLLCLYLIRLILAPTPDMSARGPPSQAASNASTAPSPSQQPPQLRDFTLAELRAFDGRTPQTPLYMAISGKVFDVSAGRHFYGPGGPYSAFAGRDASRGLAKMDTQSPASNMYDDLADLTRAERDILADWAAKLGAKYPQVGRLRPEAAEMPPPTPPASLKAD